MAVVAVMMFSCAGTNETTDATAMDTESDAAVGVVTTDEVITTEPVANTDVDYGDMFDDIDNTEQYDVLALARMNPNLSTFVQLVEQSGLAASLQAAGPVTLFAPTNEAFQQMSKERSDFLMDPNNRTELVKILNMHVLPSEVPTMQFTSLSFIDRGEEEDIPVNVEMNGTVVYVGGAQIVKGDVEASNGVLHVVNGVLDPSEWAGADID